MTERKYPMMELFAGELRRLRQKAGLTQEALGDRIGWSASLVALVEQCRRPPRLEFAERCDEELHGEGILLRIREAILRESLMPWFREWAMIEREATELRSFEPLVLPGLLQTEDYARALYEGAAQLAGDELDQPVAARLARQKIFDRETPPLFVVALDSGVVERCVGGPKVMRGQLLHLLEMGRRPKVNLHLVPKDIGVHPGLNGPFVLASQPERDDIAYLDNQLHGTVVERPADVLSLRRTWESILAEAVSHKQSMLMISEAAESWN